MSRTRWRPVARNGLLLVLGVCAACILIEHVLEVRDATRLTANDTFCTAGGRRIRYHLTGANSPGPTVVLLTGLAASLEQWDGVQTALGTASPVLSYDRSGTGFSDPADAHDADADAKELNQLLQCAKLVGPIELVSYSSSSMMATVFVARHRDRVKGMLFVDPSLRSLAPGAKTYRRILLRPTLINPLQALFGYTRLKFAIEGRNGTPPAAVAQRSSAVLESTHHWLASAYDSMRLDISADEADAAMATHPFVGMPLGVLTTANPEGTPESRDNFARQKALAASSEQGFIHQMHGDHSQLVNDPVAIGHIVEAIRAIADGARAKDAASAELKRPVQDSGPSPL